MSIDVLQEKIRKTKNPSMVDLALKTSDLPPHLLEEAGSSAAAYGRFCRELLEGLKGIVPAVRFSFASFAGVEYARRSKPWKQPSKSLK